MSVSEYRKVIDVIAGSLGAGKSVELNYSHDTSHKIDVIDVKMLTAGDETIECRVNLRTTHLEIVFNKKYFTQAKFEKFLSRFEYDLEQVFTRNIHIERVEESLEYRIRVDA